MQATFTVPNYTKNRYDVRNSVLTECRFMYISILHDIFDVPVALLVIEAIHSHPS